MRRITLSIISEAVIIFISAILGTYTWNHGSYIFNNYNPLNWMTGFCEDVGKYPRAWYAFGIFLAVLIVVLFYRVRSDKTDELNKKDIGKINKKIQKHIQKQRRSISRQM